MSRTKKISALIMAIVLCLSCTSSVFALEPVTFSNFNMGEQAVNAEIGKAEQPNLKLPCKSAILMEASTGRILYENNADEQLPPASITKIMTLLLVMEALEEGRINLEDKVNVSEHAMSMGGSQIWLEPGEELTVDELLKATAVASANDASVALGEHVAGSHEAFVEMMNNRAKELGMTNTTFINATGLDADGHLSTAHDIALMSKELIKHEYILKYTTIWMDSLRNGATELVNTNKLVRFYDGCTGLKTGTTNGAGSCLSATANRNDLKLIAVVMGSDNSQDRFDSARALLDYGYSKYQMADVPALEEGNFETLPVKKGLKDQVELEYQVGDKVIIPKGKEKELTCEVQFTENLSAPVEKGQIVGKMVVKIEGEIIGEYKISAKEEVPVLGLMNAFTKIGKHLFSNK